MMPIAEINWAVCLLAAFLAGMKLQETIQARRRAALIQIGRETIASAINRIKGRDLGGGDRRGDAGRLADVPQAQEGDSAGGPAGDENPGDNGGNQGGGDQGRNEPQREDGRSKETRQKSEG